jgi:hypothetical protein
MATYRYVFSDPRIVERIGHLEVPSTWTFTAAQWIKLTELLKMERFAEAECLVMLFGGRFVR